MAVNGLEKMKEKILEEARADAAKTVADAQTQADAVKASYDAKIEAMRAETNDRATREVKSILNRAESSAEALKRNTVLSMRGSMIDEAFREALAEIRQMPREEYLALLTSLLATALAEQIEAERVSLELYGEPEEPLPTTYEILLNAEDRAAYGSELIDSVRRSVVNKIPLEAVKKLVLSDKTAPIDGGLVLKYGDIEINCSIAMIFSQIRPGLEAEIEQVLFEEAEA